MDRTRTIQTEDGTVLREYTLRNLIPGDALRAVNFTMQTLRIARRRQSAPVPEDPEDLEAVEAFEELQASVLDRITGAEGYLVGFCVEGCVLPPGDTPWRRGVAMVQQLFDEGWTIAEVSAVYLDCLDYAQSITLPRQTAQKVVAVANFSHPPTDSTTAS